MPSLKCPKCGSDRVIKGGSNSHHGSKTGEQRYKCRALPCTWYGTQPIGLEVAQQMGVDPDTVNVLLQLMKGAKTLIVTSAQNATPVHAGFLKSLRTACRDKKAVLVVTPYRYKNVTSRWSKKAEGDDWWAEEIQGDLFNRRYRVDKHLELLGDIMTQPTASSPLNGFETISGDRSAILGHPKLQLKCVPTPQSRLPKILTTTGSVTKRNYVPSKAGKQGEFHHTFGAAIVELDEGGRFHLRQIVATNDGSFIDLDTEYDGDRIERGVPLEALTMGDTHEEFVCPNVMHATFGKLGIVPTLKPKRLIWHDLHDFYARNHHHRGDPFKGIAKQRAGRDDVEVALRQTFAFLDKHTPVGVQSVIVNSNHPNAFARWVKEADWKTDPVNAEFYLESALVMTRAAKMTAIGAETEDPFVYWGKRWLKSLPRVTFLCAGQSYMVKGIDNGFHGHEGANGSRGTLAQFDKIGVRTNTGHGHSAGIEGGAWRGGTSTPLKLEYSGGGPGSWLNTHIMGYRNGKRSLVNVIDGFWRG